MTLGKSVVYFVPAGNNEIVDKMACFAFRNMWYDYIGRLYCVHSWR